MTQIEYLPIKQLQLLDGNPRKITKQQFAKLCKSLEEDNEFFDLRPCLVNHIVSTGQMIVYAGNQRLLAAKKLKRKEVPCIVKLDVPEEVMRSRIIKDNKQYGEFDFDILANEWDTDILLDAGFTDAELSFSAEIEKVESEEKQENPPKCLMCPKCGYEIT